MEVKRLFRSKENKVFAGICGGLGEYFEVDPVVIRLFSLLIIVLSGVLPGVVVYLLALTIVPKRS